MDGREGSSHDPSLNGDRAGQAGGRRRPSGPAGRAGGQTAAIKDIRVDQGQTHAEN
ncbi:hypothetical protein Pa4123_45000 [Phytohabitans aurantiacus]|uniref:Uncharacterized protein n=1 Tax=Phytohabitans aurantiacus TaxID=3016789 RepID=A0ABQ5R0W9_9ACTN|nr:hypothetical protein Pa4123_45000 [Phytohabitans aurantiacus]